MSFQNIAKVLVAIRSSTCPAALSLSLIGIRRSIASKNDNIPTIKPTKMAENDLQDKRRMTFKTEIRLQRADITRLPVDAIVNAANRSLLGGGGVDGAIHHAAGGDLYDECRTLGGCDEGEAVITLGHRLPAKYILHTVGPNCGFRGFVTPLHRENLRRCYESCLETIKEHNQRLGTKQYPLRDRENTYIGTPKKSPIRTVAFPCISTGIYGYPQKEAVHVALKTTRDWLEENPDQLECLVFCLFLESDLKLYTRHFKEYFPEHAQFTEPLPFEQVETLEDEMTELACEVSEEALQVTWYKGDSRISESDEKYEIREDGTHRSLIIEETTKEDEGEYSCVLPEGVPTRATVTVIEADEVTNGDADSSGDSADEKGGTKADKSNVGKEGEPPPAPSS